MQNSVLTMEINSTKILLVGLALGVTAFANGQSVVVLGEDSAARDCFRSAEQSINFAVSGIYSADQVDIDRCTEVLERGALSIKDRVATLVNRGILQAALGDVTGATQSYNEALELAADRGEVYVNIANVYMRQKLYPKAIETYSLGLELMTKKHHVGHLNRGLAYEYLRDYQNAHEDYSMALVYRPEWLRAKKMLARVEAKLATSPVN